MASVDPRELARLMISRLLVGAGEKPFVSSSGDESSVVVDGVVDFVALAKVCIAAVLEDEAN
jgi:hypothetical protein